MDDEVIDYSLAEVSEAEIARITGVCEAQLTKWISNKVVGTDRTVYALVDAAAARSLTAAGVPTGSLRRLTELVTEHLLFHLLQACPTAILTMKARARGGAVKAPRHRGVNAHDFAQSFRHEPYRYVRIERGCIWFSARRGARFPDGSRGDVQIDLREIARDVGSRVQAPLIVSVCRPERSSAPKNSQSIPTSTMRRTI